MDLFNFGGTAPDPFWLDPNIPRERNRDGKVEVPILLPASDNAVFVTLGQSNICNYGYGGNYTPTNAASVLNFDYTSGGLYRAQDPLLGCDTAAASANVATRIGDKLVAAAAWNRVVIAPCGRGGAGVGGFRANGGELNHHIPVMCKRLAAAALPVTAILWHQGESDAGTTTQADYVARLQSAIQTFRDNGVSAPFFVAKVSWVNNITDPVVRAAQAAIVSTPAAIYAGPDTDTLGTSYRGDVVHFNAAGLEAHADLWVTVLRSHFGV